MTTSRSRYPRSHSRPRSRDEHKELTRQALLRAGLRLLSKNSFDSISLREVTREAGISPTAFYRHFDDMEELGLVLVDEAFGSLGQMLRRARSNPEAVHDAVRRSVAIVVDHVADHEAHMRFIARERHGGVRRIRRAIERELGLFASEVALDLAAFPVVSGWQPHDRRMLADLIVEVMVSMVGDLVDAEPAQHAARVRQAEHHLRLVVLGAQAWRPRAGAAQPSVSSQPA